MSGTGDGGPAEGAAHEQGPADGGPADGGAAEDGPAEDGPADGGPADGGPAESEHGPADGGLPSSSARGKGSEAAGPAGSGGAGPAGGGARGGGPADGGPGGDSSQAAAPAGSGSAGPAGGAAHGGAPDGRGADAGGLGNDGSEAAAAEGSGGGGSGDGTAAGATAGSGGPADPGELLGEVRALRRRARLARHAYWFPLVLFGLLALASVPFYIRRLPRGQFTYSRLGGPSFLQSEYLGGFGFITGRGTAYYWLGAMLFGIAATVLWYRWRGNRVGLRTPARGYLITGLIIVALALLVPLVGRGSGAGMFLVMPGDLVGRGTFPFVLIGLGLCFLAWAERSVGLAAIAAVYLALALVASLYDIQNVFYNWFGLSLSPTVGTLPNVVLPALVLLLTGAGAWIVQRRYRPPAEPESAEG